MRFATRFRLALIGLALAAPAAAMADGPDDCQACQQRSSRWASRAPKVCAHCLAKQRANPAVIPPPPVMMPPGGCTACQAQGEATMMMAPGTMMMAPGTTVEGGPAPGYAVVGGAIPMSEPSPIGVVQATYQPAGVPSAMPPGRATTGGPGMPNMATAAPAVGSANTLGSPPHRRPRIFTSLFNLPEFGARRQAREDEARTAHAAIRYGDDGQPTSQLPASVVYGR